MSRKTGVGVGNKQYLFEASKYELTNEEKQPITPLNSEFKEGRNKAPQRESNLRLEQINGHNGFILRSLLAFPGETDRIVKTAGSSVICVNTSDSSQSMLLGHDATICSMAFSISGKYLATGQVGSRKTREGHAKALIWDMQTNTVLTGIYDIDVAVNILKFSPDELFMLMTAQDGSIRVWDIKNKELAAGVNLSRPICLAEWITECTDASLDKSNSYRKKSYILMLSTGQSTWLTSFHFDTTKMQWNLYPSNATQALDITRSPPLSHGAFSIPLPHGLQSRLTGVMDVSNDGGNGCNTQSAFTCSVLSPDASYLFAGQSTGEIAVFRLGSSGTYRGSLPVCRGVIANIIAIPVSSKRFDLIVCGGSDIKQLSGGDMRWEVTRCFPTRPRANVSSLNLTSLGREMIVGYSDGEITRQLLDSDGCLQIESGHTSNVNSLSFLPGGADEHTDIFATSSQDGSIKIWSLEDDSNRYIARCLNSIGNINGCCTCWTKENDKHLLVVGDASGNIKCMNVLEADDDGVIWTIPTAHRGRVTCVAFATDNSTGARFLLSGGDDCAVRAWRINLSSSSSFSVPSHQPVIETRMSQPIKKMCSDITSHELVHISDDRSIQSFNLRHRKQSAVYDYRSMFPPSTLLESAQKMHMPRQIDGKCVNYSDNEIITTDDTGRVMFWETNYPSATDKMTASLVNLQVEMAEVSPQTGAVVHQALTCLAQSSVNINGVVEYVMAFGTASTDGQNVVHHDLKLTKLPPSPSVISHLSNVCRRDGRVVSDDDSAPKFQPLEVIGVGFGHTEEITHLEFGQSAKNSIVTVGRDGCVCVWRVK